MFSATGDIASLTTQTQNRKNLLTFSGKRVNKNEREQHEGGYEGIFPFHIVICQTITIIKWQVYCRVFVWLSKADESDILWWDYAVL